MAMAPNSVARPVATTTARPEPLTTCVPSQRALVRRAITASAGDTPGFLSTG